MAKKSNSKVSITKVDEYLKAAKTEPVALSVTAQDGTVLEFEVKPVLSLAEFHSMVHAVANASFIVDAETGMETYDAVYHRYAHDIAILTYVANFKSEMTSEKLFALAQCDEILLIIMDNWNVFQRNAFNDAVVEQIDFKQQELLARERKLLTEVTTQIESVANSMNQLVAAFGDIEPQSLLGEMQKITAMDENRLGHAVVAARDPDFVEQRRADLQVLK